MGFIRPFLREKKAWNNRVGKKGGVVLCYAITKTIFYAYTKKLQIQPKKLLCFYTSQTHHFNQSLYLPRTQFRFLFMESIPFFILITNPRRWFEVRMEVSIPLFLVITLHKCETLPKPHVMPRRQSILGKKVKHVIIERKKV